MTAQLKHILTHMTRRISEMAIKLAAEQLLLEEIKRIDHPGNMNIEHKLGHERYCAWRELVVMRQEAIA